jgi:hypothetical protein
MTLVWDRKHITIASPAAKSRARNEWHSLLPVIRDVSKPGAEIFNIVDSSLANKV